MPAFLFASCAEPVCFGYSGSTDAYCWVAAWTRSRACSAHLGRRAAMTFQADLWDQPSDACLFSRYKRKVTALLALLEFQGSLQRIQTFAWKSIVAFMRMNARHAIRVPGDRMEGEGERWAEDGGRRSTRLGFVSIVTFVVTGCWQCGWERRRVRINSLNARRSDVSRQSLLLSLQQILQVCCQRTSLIQRSHTAGDLYYKINFLGEKNILSFSSSNLIIF